MDGLQINKDSLCFTINVPNNDFVATPVPLNFKSSRDAQLKNIARWHIVRFPDTSKKYIGIIRKK